MKNAFLYIIFVFIYQNLLSQVFVTENTDVTLKNEVGISIAGNLNNNGRFRGSGFMKLVSNKSQAINGNGQFENFSIDKTSGQVEIPSGNQDVLRVFEIHGGNFVPNSNLTLKSSDTLTAQIGKNTGGTITGDLVIERFIPKTNRAFRYLSSPVKTTESIKNNLQEGQNNTGTNYPNDNINTLPGFGTHITGSTTGANGFDATLSGNSSFFNWDNETQSWNTISNTNTNTLNKGESFVLLIRGSRATRLDINSATGPETTLRLTGNPTILDFSKEISLTSEESFVLLGNPYHAAIDANLVLQRNTSLNPNFVYVYDPTLNTQGGYATVELNNGGINAQGSDANQFIQGWQSVFVQALNTEPASFNLSFSEDDKSVSEPQVEIFSTDTRVNLKLKKENKTIDGVSIKLKHGANSEVDQSDALKFWNYDENLSIYNKANYISIEERDFPQTTDTIMVRLDQKREDNYEFVIDGSNISQTEVVFKDFYLDTDHFIKSNEETVVEYQVAEGEPDLRFGFIINPKTLSTDEFDSQVFQVYPNPAKNLLNIKILKPTDEDLKFEIYSLLGQKIAEGEFKPQHLIKEYDISNFQSGVYLILLTDNKNLKETLKFVKL